MYLLHLADELCCKSKRIILPAVVLTEILQTFSNAVLQVKMFVFLVKVH